MNEIVFEKCLRVLVEMTSSDAEAALTEAHPVLSILDRANDALPVLLHGEAGSVGSEDGVHLPDGAVATDNAELVRAAIQRRG